MVLINKQKARDSTGSGHKSVDESAQRDPFAINHQEHVNDIGASEASSNAIPPPDEEEPNSSPIDFGSFVFCRISEMLYGKRKPSLSVSMDRSMYNRDVNWAVNDLGLDRRVAIIVIWVIEYTDLSPWTITEYISSVVVITAFSMNVFLTAKKKVHFHNEKSEPLSTQTFAARIENFFHDVENGALDDRNQLQETLDKLQIDDIFESLSEVRKAAIDRSISTENSVVEELQSVCNGFELALRVGLNQSTLPGSEIPRPWDIGEAKKAFDVFSKSKSFGLTHSNLNKSGQGSTSIKPTGPSWYRVWSFIVAAASEKEHEPHFDALAKVMVLVAGTICSISSEQKSGTPEPSI